MSPVFENVSVDCFNSALAVNKSNGKLFYWCTPHFSYEYKTYGSNGTEICRASFLGSDEGWYFDDRAIGGSERVVKESLTEGTKINKQTELYNDIIKYLQKMVEQDEDALEEAKKFGDKEVIAAIEKRLENSRAELKAALEPSTKGVIKE
jgi:hypothetical protein